MILSPVSSMVPLVTVVTEFPSDSSIWKSKRKALYRPNRMQGAAHTATTSTTTQPRALQQWQQCGKCIYMVIMAHMINNDTMHKSMALFSMVTN